MNESNIAPFHSNLKETNKDPKWVAGLIGGLVANLLGFFVAFVLFFVLGGPIIFNPALQSPKLIAVWTKLEPLPLTTTNLPAFLVGIAMLGLITGGVFAGLAKALPQTAFKRGAVFGLVLWLLVSTFFEFFTPLNLFGEPLPLVTLELSFWFIVTQTQGHVLSQTYNALTR